jgi:hypothetical protein
MRIQGTALLSLQLLPGALVRLPLPPRQQKIRNNHDNLHDQSSIVIQMILRHKSASTTEGYLRTIGLEDARSHLEDLGGRDNESEVVSIKEHFGQKRSQPG